MTSNIGHVPACSVVPENAPVVDRGLFLRLHPQGRQLIAGWADRGAGVPDDSDVSTYFERFIYLWFGVNGWGSCVTGTDVDRDWVNGVASDRQLGALFAGSLRADRRFADRARAFADFWPIFKSSEIRRRGIWIPQNYSREQRVREYLDNHITFEPSCWHEHNDQPPPLDWKHTLKTLYRVRCNLFHGEKTLNSENDRQIVRAAYSVLATCIRHLGLTAGSPPGTTSN